MSSIKRALCKDFVHGQCKRAACRFHHNYVYCHDFQNTAVCDRESCMFLHVSHEEKINYEQDGRQSETFAMEVQRTRQTGDVCKDNLHGVCSRLNCKFKHLNIHPLVPLACPVCFNAIMKGEMYGFGECDHALCKSCLNSLETLSFGRTECPMCRSIGVATLLT